MSRLIFNLVDWLDERGGSSTNVMCVVVLFSALAMIGRFGSHVTDLLAPGASWYRFVAGCLLGAYAMGGRTVAKVAWVKFRYQKRLFSTKSLLSLSFSEVASVIGGTVMCGIGVICWFVGWNGTNTATEFGAGAFVGISIYGWSIGRFVEARVISPIVSGHRI